MNLFLIIDDQWSLTINIFPSSFDFDMTSASPPSLFHLAPGLESDHSVVDLEGGTQLDAEPAQHIVPLQNQKAGAVNLFVEENLGVPFGYPLLHQVLTNLRWSELRFVCQNSFRKYQEFTLAGDHFEQSGRVKSSGRSWRER